VFELFPLAPLAIPGTGQDAAGDRALTLAERRPGSFVEIACWSDEGATAKALADAIGAKRPPQIGRGVTAPGQMLLSVGPDRYLALSQETGLANLLAGAVAAEAGALVDLTHGRTGLRISGAPAERLLQKGVSFDLGKSAFPAMSVASTAIHHIGVTLIRADGDTFDVFAMSSFAESLWDWVTDAAVEFGWTVAAPAA